MDETKKTEQMKNGTSIYLVFIFFYLSHINKWLALTLIHEPLERGGGVLSALVGYPLLDNPRNIDLKTIGSNVSSSK